MVKTKNDKETNPYDWSPPPGGRTVEIPIGKDGVIRLVHPKSAESLPHLGYWDYDIASLKVSKDHRKHSKLQSQIAEAVAIQKALELRKHINDEPWADGVVLWLGSSGAQLYRLDWDPGTYSNGFEEVDSAEDCRYYSGRSSGGMPSHMSYIHAISLALDPDVEGVISRNWTDEESSTNPTLIHLGKVPHVIREQRQLDMIRSGEHDSASAAAATSLADSGEWFSMTIIEFCCSEDSKLADERFLRPGIRIIRLTERHI